MTKHSPLPWRTEGVGDDAVIYDANGIPRFGATAYYPWVEEDDFPFIVRACNNHEALLAALKECRNAVAAALRVVADLDAMHLLNADADTRQARFIDELKAAGVVNGFGIRADAAIANAEGPSE